jgi:hypothetical protein
VITAIVAVEIVQDFVSYVDGHTLTKSGVNPTSIEKIYDEEALMGLMVNVSMIISREVRPKLLCTKVDEEVVV